MEPQKSISTGSAILHIYNDIMRIIRGILAWALPLWLLGQLWAML